MEQNVQVLGFDLQKKSLRILIAASMNVRPPGAASFNRIPTVGKFSEFLPSPCKMLLRGLERSLNSPECRGGEKQLQIEQGMHYVEKIENH